ncbi:MAG: TIGR01459 family HAD-type hydrolase [Pseudomonadota bacterium]
MTVIPSSQIADLSGPIQIVSSIAPFGQGRRAWLVDIWGVMHNGVRPFATAVAACQTFRRQGGIVVLLSNSPRTGEGVIAQLRQVGVPDDAYDGAVTSGDATRVLIRQVSDRPIFHLGPERDRPSFKGIDVVFADAETADTIVCTGLFDDRTETADNYNTLLKGFAARGVEMICANPDITVERDGKIIFCAGALAERYEALGGVARLAGKPHAPIYDMAFERLADIAGAPVKRADVLAIGDGVKTDIAGALAADLDAVYIASAVGLGLGGALDPAALNALFPDPTARPIAAMTELAW